MRENLDLLYPIGKVTDQPFSKDGYNENVKLIYLTEIQKCPALLENSISNLGENQMNFPYCDGGRTPKQLIHHIADSHMNGYIRFKLVLTEDELAIKIYNKAAYSQLSDTKNLPINISLSFLHSLHIIWIDLMKNMDDADWQKKLYQPEYKRKMTLWDLLKTYVWHGKHHVAHITALRERCGW